MSEHPNIVATRKGYAAFSDANIDGIREFLHPEVVWHQGGHDALSGDYKGVDAVLGLFAKQYELAGGNITVELLDVYATDTRTIAIEHFVARRNEKTLDQTFPIVFNGTNGVTREVWVYSFGDEEEAAAFWA